MAGVWTNVGGSMHGRPAGVQGPLDVPRADDELQALPEVPHALVGQRLLPRAVCQAQQVN